MKDRISFDKLFMAVAYLFANRSSCVRKQVGGVLVKDDRIICCGYNGVPHGVEHCDEIFKGLDMSLPENKAKHKEFSDMHELHCESNILAYCAQNGISTKGTTLYSTLSPCITCAKLIVTCGITKVIYDELYDRPEISGIDFLEKNGVEVKNICTFPFDCDRIQP